VCDTLRALLNGLGVALMAHKETLPSYCGQEALSNTFNLRGWWELLQISLPGALTVWSGGAAVACGDAPFRRWTRAV
jgi:hypothetical protein